MWGCRRQTGFGGGAWCWSNFYLFIAKITHF